MPDFGTDRKNSGKIGGPGNCFGSRNFREFYSAIIVRDRLEASIARRLVLEPIAN